MAGYWYALRRAPNWGCNLGNDTLNTVFFSRDRDFFHLFDSRISPAFGKYALRLRFGKAATGCRATAKGT